MPLDIPSKFALIQDVCTELRGAEYCSPTVVQAIAALARHETGFGTYRPFARPATSTEPAWSSNNWGAQQCGKIADKNGQCPPGCFPATDTSPTAAGTSIAYTACFQVNLDERAGALSLVRLVAVQRPGIAAALPSGDAQQIAQAMHDARYFEGFGATVEVRVAGYAKALERNAQINAAAAHVENLILIPPPSPPEPPRELSDEERIGVATMFAALLAAGLRTLLRRPSDPSP